VGTWRRRREGSTRDQWQIRPVIADHRHLIPGHTMCQQQSLCRCEFVGLTKTSVSGSACSCVLAGKAEVRQSTSQGWMVASGHHQGRDARLTKQLEAMSVEHMERLERLACIAVPKTAVRQYAVDIKDGRLHADVARHAPLRLQQHFRGKA
jgi:hypothetical protein